MKTHQILFLFSILILPFLAGCPQRKTVLTTINKDGSCVRTIGNFDLRKFSSIDSLIHDLPIPIDRSWSLDTINDSTAMLYQRFESIDALNKMYSNDKSELSRCKRKVELKKEFRWFYTGFKYYETYGGVLTEIPLSNYLLELEVSALISNDTEKYLENTTLERKSRKALSDNIEERLGFWLNDCIYSMAFDEIVSMADSMHLMAKENYDLLVMKDTIKQQVEKVDKRIISFDNEEQLGMEDLAVLISKSFNLDTVSMNILTDEVRHASLDEKYEDEILFGFMEDYDHNIIMPGLLIDTNAEVIKGDTLNWDITAVKYIGSDFVMYAESRITNTWAYIVSGIIVLIAVSIPFLGRFRKQLA